MESFTRRETLVLTRSSPGQLTYLSKTGLVRPCRHGQSQFIYYTWDQILEIRTINRLRRHLSFQTIRKIADFLRENGFSPSLRDKHLVILADGVSWVRSDAQTLALVQLTGRQNKHVGQLLLSLPPWTRALEERWERARACEVIDFQQFRRTHHSPAE